MFKKRLKVLTLSLFATIAIMVVWLGFCLLLDKYTPIRSWFEWLPNTTAIALTMIGSLLLYLLFKFMKWLFIEPLVEWRRKKLNSVIHIEEEIDEREGN